MKSRADFPGVLAQIAEAAGDEAARKLAEARGGTDFYIPSQAAGSLLSQIVGLHAAQKIIETIGAGRIALPAGAHRGSGARRRMAMELLSRGMSQSQVCLRMGLDQRTVERYSAQLRGARDDRQGELPL